jgi:hypothetical protein
MADDRMKNDDLQRNMGTSGKEGQNFGQQTPGRQGQSDHDFGHEGGRIFQERSILLILRNLVNPVHTAIATNRLT